MEKAKQPSEFVKSLDKRLFWDVGIADIGERRHRRFIIQRVLERGSMEDIRGTVRHYGMPEFTAEAKMIRSLDPITLSFAACLCKVPKEAFRCRIWNP